jgi:hypothetical protein
VNEALDMDAEDFELPEIEVPEAWREIVRSRPPLIDSAWSLGEQTRRLIASKRYQDGGGRELGSRRPRNGTGAFAAFWQV